MQFAPTVASFLSFTQGLTFILDLSLNALFIFYISELNKKSVMQCRLGKDELVFQWLMFDFDNTLTDFHEASLLSFEQTFKDYELKYDPDYYKVYEKVNAKIWDQFERKLITTEDIRKQRFKLFFEEIKLENIDGYEFNAQYLSNIVHFTTIRPEVVSLLKKLRQNYKLSIITNGLKEVQRARLDKCGITDLFDSIIVSDEIGVAKPDKLFFDYTMKSISTKIDKNKILVIGDSLKSDIAGAKLYKLKSCLISKKKHEDNVADIIISDVIELEKVLAEIYFPVNCDWYDYLEIYAMRKTVVDIEYSEGEISKKVTARIENLIAKNKEEFAVLSDGNKIRLDHIVTVQPLNKSNI